MRISFIGCKENTITIFKELARELSIKVSGLELAERFVPSIEDIPIVALEESEQSDFIVVFAIIENEEEKKLLEEKLVDVELKSQTRIFKGIEEDEFSDLEEEEYLEVKDVLVQRYVDTILGILFNENEFEPEDRDFGL